MCFCVQRLGKEKFLRLYSYLLDHRISSGRKGDNLLLYDKDEEEMMLDVETIVGEENVDFLAIVEQVLLSETS